MAVRPETKQAASPMSCHLDSQGAPPENDVAGGAGCAIREGCESQPEEAVLGGRHPFVLTTALTVSDPPTPTLEMSDKGIRVFFLEEAPPSPPPQSLLFSDLFSH